MKKRLISSMLAAVVIGIGIAGTAQAVPFALRDIFASTNNGNIQHYNAAGTLLETLNTGQGSFTTGSAFDNAGNFYVTNFGANTVSKFPGPGDPHSPTSLFGSGYSTPEAIVFAGDGNVLIGNVSSGGIREFTSAGVFVKTIMPGVRVDWFDLAADQSTILFTQEGGKILTGSRSSGLQGANLETGVGDFAIRILKDGTILVANNENVVHLTAAGVLIQSYDVTGVDGFFALNLDPDGTSFITGSFNNDKLYRFDIATGGVDTETQTITTGAGGNLFGVSMFGEITVGNPPPTGVPEPASLALLVTGLVGLAAARRRRKA